MVYDKPITLEKMDENTEKWSIFARLHARVNKTGSSEFLNAGAERSKNTLTFEVRYFKNLENIRFNTQLYRLIYRGQRFNIVDYDDYLEEHKTIKLVGVSY